MTRLLSLFKMHILSFFHKIWHDFGRELVIGICSCILFALFYYIFDDFLNEELRKISPIMRDRFAEFFAYVILCVGAASAGRILHAFFTDPRSLLNTLRLYGENPQICRALAIFHVVLILSLVDGLLLLLVRHILVGWSPTQTLIYGTITIFISLASSQLPQRKAKTTRDWQTPPSLSALSAMVRWRLHLFFLRNQVAQFCLALFVLCTLLVAVLALRNLPFLAAFAVAFWGGFIGACALSFQFTDDLHGAWLEKTSGISHQLYMHTLSTVAGIVGVLLGSMLALVYGCADLWLHGMNWQSFEAALRLFFITALPMWVLPAVFFAIDPRRALIPILLSFLISLFVGTAILASWFGLALLGLIAYYEYTLNEGRFYRA